MHNTVKFLFISNKNEQVDVGRPSSVASALAGTRRQRQDGRASSHEGAAAKQDGHGRRGTMSACTVLFSLATAVGCIRWLARKSPRKVLGMKGQHATVSHFLWHYFLSKQLKQCLIPCNSSKALHLIICKPYDQHHK